MTSLCPFSHPDRPESLNNLALTLGSRFEDLDIAIELYREALKHRSSDDRSMCLKVSHQPCWGPGRTVRAAGLSRRSAYSYRAFREALQIRRSSDDPSGTIWIVLL